ncbi:MAG: hypothetical protein ACR2HM_01660 [Acidimicrobiales bacterium]
MLLALVPLIGTGSSFSADEGAAIVQARSLERGDGWIVAHPFPDVDATGANYPLENSERGTRGTSPYAKHPLYPLVLAASHRVAGVAGMVLVSLAGTLCASALSALIARRLHEALVRPTVWVVGLASPLLFDGYVVIAHTVAAALAAGAVLLALRASERRSIGTALAVAPCVAAAVLFRTEAVFFAAGLAVVAGALGMASRRSRLPLLTVAGGALLAAVVTMELEDRWTAHLVGAASGPGSLAASVPGVGLGRQMRGFLLTWLTTGYSTSGLVDLALFVVAWGTVVAAVVVRRRPERGGLVVGLSVLVTASAALAVATGPVHLVPGLLIAFPLLAAGLVLLDRTVLSTETARLAFGAFVVFAIGVIATQYERGGSGEWGGRYFALGIPLLVPVALLAIRNAGRRLQPGPRRVAAGALVACMVAMTAMGVATLRESHRRADAMNRAIRAGIGSLPAAAFRVVVATDGTLARKAWPTFDEARLLLSYGDLEDLAGRLDAAGVRQFVVVTRTSPPTVSLGSRAQIVSAVEGTSAGQTRVLVVRIA